MLEARPQATHFVPGNLLRAALCLLGPLPLLAQGGPPLLTDDPGTPGNRNWEINISSTQFWRNTERELQSPLVDINYGLGDRTQLKYQACSLTGFEEVAAGVERATGRTPSRLGTEIVQNPLTR